MRPRALLIAGAVAAAPAGGCDAGATKQIGLDNPATSCLAAPTTPPDGIDSFYGKYLDGNGIPVLASSAVSDTALSVACVIVVRMLGLRDDVRARIMQQQMRVAVIGRNEVTTNIPEYANLYTMFPGQDWDRLRGVGATLIIPVSSVGEENLLCLADDVFRGEKILVQTFATAVQLGLESLDSTFESRLDAAHDAAVGAGLWRNTYAELNIISYYSEGMQGWFDANGEASPADGTHNEVNTRAELMAYDLPLSRIIGEAMPNDSWRPACP
jgi:hypothetical protein